MINVIIGSNSLIGKNLIQLLKKKKKFKKFKCFSRNIKVQNNINYVQLDLDKSIANLSKLKINKCFFFASPKYYKKNFTKKIFEKEYFWIKKVLKNCSINKMIYLSSSTIYQKDHFIGLNKLKAEKFLKKNKSKFKCLQIWRPFNLISYEQTNLTDHFHNYLFKIIFLKKRKSVIFNGNTNDMRGYSSVADFVKILYKFSNQNKNFTKNFGNPNLISVKNIIEIYNSISKKKLGYELNYKFNSNRSNVNSVNNLNKRNTIYSKIKSNYVIKKFLKNMLKNFFIKSTKTSRQNFF
jgi:nucleoside-diphosphate-sugar epimerase